MDKIAKALQNLSPKERLWVAEVFLRIDQGLLQGLDIKKIKGDNDIFRVRKGELRIIFRKRVDGENFILDVTRRSDNTYHSY